MNPDPIQAPTAHGAARERARLAALHAYRVLDTGRDPLLEHLAELAASLCGTGISAINFLDDERLWTKAAHGFPPGHEAPRPGTFCNETIRSPGITEIPDIALDARFAGSPLARAGGLRFYAGAPLEAPGGEAIGTLCVMDAEPRDLSQGQRDALRRLADIAMAIIERYRPDRQLGALVESSPVPILFFGTRDWRWRHVNASGLASLGLAIEDVEHADPAWFSADYAAGALAARLAPLVEGRVAQATIDTEHRRLDGTRFPVEVSFSAALTGGDAVVIAFAHDVSDRRRLAEERRERQRFFDMASEMFLILGPGGRVLQTNRQVHEALGHPVDAMVGHALAGFVADDDRARAEAAFARCADGGESVEAQLAFVRADGERRLLRLDGRCDGGDRIHLVGRDITESARGAKAPAPAGEGLRGEREPVHRGPARRRSRRLIEYVNPAFERVTGYSPAEAVGHDCRFLQADDRDQPAIAEMAAAIAARRPCQVTLRNYRKDGRLFHNDVVLSPVPGDDGVVTHYIGVQYDVTELKAQQERIARLDRTQACVAAVGRAIVREHSDQSLLQEVCEIAVGLGGYALAWAGLLDADGAMLIPSAACGIGTDTVRTMTIVPDGAGTGPASIAGRALRSTAPTVCNDLRTAAMAERWRARALAGGIESFAYLPVVRDGTVGGLVAFYAAEAAAFDDEEVRLLQGVVTEVAFALDSIDKGRRIAYLASHDPLTGLPDAQALEAGIDDALRAAGTTAGARVAVVMLDIERLKMVSDAFGKGAGDELLRDLALRLGGLGGDAVRVSRTRAGPFVVSVAGLASVGAVQQWIEERVLQHAGAAVSRRRRGALRLGALRGGGLARRRQRRRDAGRPRRVGAAAGQEARRAGGLLLARDERPRGAVAGHRERAAPRHRARGVRAALPAQAAPGRRPHERLRGAAALAASAARAGFAGPLRRHPGGHRPHRRAGAVAGAPGAGRRGAARPRGRARAARRRQRVAGADAARRLRRLDRRAARRRGAGRLPARHRDHREPAHRRRRGGDREAAPLRGLGVGIAIDDFGTGYSSLAYIARLPFDALKIDQSFVRDMTTRSESAAIVASIVALARSLDKTSIAEGVESAAEQERLRELGCTQVQGYLHARPMPVGQALAWLQAREGEPTAAVPAA